MKYKKHHRAQVALDIYRTLKTYNRWYYSSELVGAIIQKSLEHQGVWNGKSRSNKTNNIIKIKINKKRNSVLAEDWFDKLHEFKLFQITVYGKVHFYRDVSPVMIAQTRIAAKDETE